MFLRTSARRPSTEPSSTPKRLMNSAVSSGSSRSSTFFRLIANFAALPFRFFCVVFFREGHVDGELFASFVAFDTVFKARDHTTPAHRQYEIRRFTAFELFAVYRTGEVDGYAVFCFNSAVFFLSEVACCLRRVSSMPSTSASVTSTIGFSTSIASRPCSSTSG